MEFEIIHLIFTFILCLFIFILSIMLLNSFTYKKKKIKEDYLIIEKNFCTCLCFIFYFVFYFYKILNDEENNNLEKKLNKIQLDIFNIYIITFFCFRLFISFEFYLLYKIPNHLFNSIIYNYKLNLWYEFILIIVCIIFYFFLEKDYNINDIPFFIFDNYKWILFLISSFISLTLYLITLNLIRKINFKSKIKLIKLLKKNIFLSLIYLIYSIYHGLIISSSILFKINKNNNISSYFSLLLILIDYLLELYFLALSKFTQYKLKSTLIYQIRKILINDNNNKINVNNLLDLNSFSKNFNYIENSLSNSEKLIESNEGDEDLIECFNNNFIIEDYFIDYYDQILNISLISIFEIYQSNKFNKRAQSRKIWKAFNISNTLSNSKSKSNEEKILNKIKSDKFNFIKHYNRDDFKDFNDFLYLDNDNLDIYSYLNVKISAFHIPNIIEVLNFRNLNTDLLSNSLIEHLNIRNKFKNFSLFKSLICSNIKEDYFNSLKNLSLKTFNKEYQIDILNMNNISYDLDILLERYFIYISNTTNTFLPILLGVFLIKINNFKPLFFIISKNSLVENKQNDTFSYWQLIRFNKNDVSSLTSSQSINKSYIVKNDPIFERSYEIENKKDNNNNKIILKNYNEFYDIIKKDLICLNKMKIKNFNLLMMYYEYENNLKHEKKGNIKIKKNKNNEAEIINIVTDNDSNNSTFNITFGNNDDDIDLLLNKTIISKNNNNFIDLNNNINICSFDGIFHHFNCLCYFIFENLFDLKKSFCNCYKENTYYNFLKNLKNYFKKFSI